MEGPRFSEFWGTISSVVVNEKQESEQALWREAEAAVRADVNYSIHLAEDAQKARERRQKREASSRVPVGV